ncbi:MAG: hypothetical protein ABH800_01825 [Candidatus Nealsonbacteria bacterium]
MAEILSKKSWKKMQEEIQELNMTVSDILGIRSGIGLKMKKGPSVKIRKKKGGYKVVKGGY